MPGTAILLKRGSHTLHATPLVVSGIFFIADSFISVLLAVGVATAEKPASDEKRTSEAQHNSKLHAHWGYVGIEGPEHWAMLSPQYMTCETGSKQSPINIHAPQHSNAQETLVFEYRPTRIYIANNGHTIQVDYKSNSMLHVNDRTYHLRQFHFHDPSEHEIEGISYPMELHLVHQNSKGHIVVVSVFLELGTANSWIASIWDWMPKTASEKLTPLSMNVADILPAHTHHYMYKGSLTTPPCTEGVEWILLKESVRISADQRKQFADIIGANARPVQPIHERDVVEY